MARLPAPDPPLTDGVIELRPPAASDVEAIARACQDPQISRFTLVPRPYTVADARTFVSLAREGYERGNAAPMVVLDADSGRLLGSCGVVEWNARDRVATLGYWAAAEARGRGVATRAARLVSRWALDVLGARRLQLEAATVNPASNAVARALGFTLEGTLRSSALAGDRGAGGDGGTDRAGRDGGSDGAGGGDAGGGDGDGDGDGERFDMNVYGCLPGELT